MIKRIPLLLAAFIVLALFSCSSQVEKSSSVSISLSENAARAVTGEASGEWNIRISLSGDITQEQIFPISEESLSENQTFLIENLEPGASVNVAAEALCGEIAYFKSKEIKTISLAGGENQVDIVLKKTVGDIDISFGNPSVLATDSDGKSYKPGSEIPYLEEVTFTIDSEISYNSYSWYLNGEKLEGSKNSISLVPAKNEHIATSTTNSLVCFFDEKHSVEFKFTFITSNSESLSE